MRGVRITCRCCYCSLLACLAVTLPVKGSGSVRLLVLWRCHTRIRMVWVGVAPAVTRLGFAALLRCSPQAWPASDLLRRLAICPLYLNSRCSCCQLELSTRLTRMEYLTSIHVWCRLLVSFHFDLHISPHTAHRHHYILYNHTYPNYIFFLHRSRQ